MLILSISYTMWPHCVRLLLFYSTTQQQEQDPTNLYISNLPLSMDEQELENMLKHFGQVISTRILRDSSGRSRGVGFARSDPCLSLLNHAAHVSSNPLTILGVWEGWETGSCTVAVFSLASEEEHQSIWEQIFVEWCGAA